MAVNAIGSDAIRAKTVLGTSVRDPAGDKIGTAPVCAGPGPDAPILGVIATTITTTANLGPVRLDDQRRKVVLVGRRDPNSPDDAASVARSNSISTSCARNWD